MRNDRFPRLVITAETLAKIARRKPTALMRQLAPEITRYAAENGIDSRMRMAMFLAMAAVETQGFTRLEENLNYSAKRLPEVWPNRFKTEAQAAKYAHNPEALANYVYGNRLGNKGKANAGWLYRGSGLMHTTGYDNFAEVERETGLPVTSHPDLLRSPDHGTRAACIFWNNRKLNMHADRGDVVTCRKIINGGLNGVNEARSYYTQALRVLDTVEIAAPAAFLAQVEPAPLDMPEERIEEELRAEGSRTIAEADAIEANAGGSWWSKIAAIGSVSGASTLLSTASYLDTMVQLALVALVAVVLLVFWLEWRKTKRLKESAARIKAARVQDAKCGVHLGRLEVLRQVRGE